MKFKLNSRSFLLWSLAAYMTGYVIYRAWPTLAFGLSRTSPGELLSSAYLVAAGAFGVLLYFADSGERSRAENRENRHDDVPKLQAECAALREELARLSANKSATTAPADDWATHNSRLFKLLPVVIATAKSEPSWPKQEALIADLVDKHGLTQADAKALDAVTRPDELRRK